MSKVFEFLGDRLVNKSGESLKTADIRGEGKVIGLYFSAHWCPPCRGFTPNLGKFYENVKGSSNGDKFDIVFVSSDRDQEAFTEYLNDMPWWALPFERREQKVINVDCVVDNMLDKLSLLNCTFGGDTEIV